MMKMGFKKFCSFFLIVQIFFSGCSATRIGGKNLVEQVKNTKGLIAFWDFSPRHQLTSIAGTAGNAKLKKEGDAIKWVEEGPVSGGSVLLNGAGDYLKIPHVPGDKLDIGSNAVTVIGWVKWMGGTGFVAGKWNEYESGGKRQYGLFVSLPYYNGANQVCGHISKSGGATKPFPFSIDYSASAQEVRKDEWACVAFTYDGKYIKSYFNGVFIKREPELIKHTKGFLADHPDGLVHSKNPYYFPEGMGNVGSDFTVGAVQLKNGMGNFFKGNIGGVAVFDRALTDGELLTIGKVKLADINK